MNLKKCLFSAAFVLLFSAVFAQPVAGDEDNGSKFYVKVYGGYSLFNPGSYRLRATAGPAPQTLFTSKQGLGLGVRAGGGIGVIASDFLNIGVDVDYLSAQTVTGKSGYGTVADENEGNTQVRLNYNALSITPNLVFKAISKPDYLIYTRIGIMANLPMEINRSIVDSLVPFGNGGNNYKVVTNGKYKFGLTAGLSVALGVQVRLTDKLRGFGEVFGHFISLLPKQYDDVSVESGSNSSQSATHTTYTSNGPLTSTTKDGVTTDVESLEDNRFNMNTIGINIGLTYRF